MPIESGNTAAGWEVEIERIAAALYGIGSMMLGEGEGTVDLVEQVVMDEETAAVHDVAEARHSACLLLGGKAIAVLAGGGASLAAPATDDAGPASCIEDDDLEAAGVTTVELEAMLTGPDNHRLRDWLEGLDVSLRVIFVLRAVAGLNSGEVAGLLAEYGGPAAADWTPGAVGVSFRQALCSLASQLLHASNTR